MASGQLVVGVSPGFYSVTLNTPVALAANTTFFIAVDTASTLVSNLTSGVPGGGFWRRQPGTGSWSASSVVRFPAYQVLCQSGGKPGAIPLLSSSGVSESRGQLSPAPLLGRSECVGNFDGGGIS